MSTLDQKVAALEQEVAALKQCIELLASEKKFKLTINDGTTDRDCAVVKLTGDVPTLNNSWGKIELQTRYGPVDPVTHVTIDKDGVCLNRIVAGMGHPMLIDDNGRIWHE